MAMTQKDLMKLLTQRFIQVKLSDGTLHAGYIGNPEDFRGETMPDRMVLVNGLLRDEVNVGDVVDVSFPKREETLNIPVVDEDLAAKYEKDNKKK